MQRISWSDFRRVELRTGTILEVQDFPEAKKPAFLLRIDFGPKIGILKSSAQITKRYSPKALIGKQVLAVVNFPVKQIGPHLSQCLVTGFEAEDGGIVLAVPETQVPNGARLL